MLEPTQRLEYLRFLIDTVEMKFFLARNKNTQNSESGREIYLGANFGKTASQFSGPVADIAGYSSSYNNCAIVFSKSPESPFQGSKFPQKKIKATGEWLYFPWSQEGS